MRNFFKNNLFVRMMAMTLLAVVIDSTFAHSAPKDQLSQVLDRLNHEFGANQRLSSALQSQMIQGFMSGSRSWTRATLVLIGDNVMPAEIMARYSEATQIPSHHFSLDDYRLKAAEINGRNHGPIYNQVRAIDLLAKDLAEAVSDDRHHHISIQLSEHGDTETKGDFRILNLLLTSGTLSVVDRSFSIRNSDLLIFLRSSSAWSLGDLDINTPERTLANKLERLGVLKTFISSVSNIVAIPNPTCATRLLRVQECQAEAD